MVKSILRFFLTLPLPMFTLLVVRVAGKVLKFDIKQFIKSCYLKMLIPFAITILFGVLLNYLITSNGWISFIIKVLIIAFIYLVLVCLLGLNKEEKSFIIKKLNKVKGK